MSVTIRIFKVTQEKRKLSNRKFQIETEIGAFNFSIYFHQIFYFGWTVHKLG